MEVNDEIISSGNQFTINKKPAVLWLAVDKVIMLILTPEVTDSLSGRRRRRG